VFDSDSKPFNIPLTEWTSIWWKWLHSMPGDRSPASDTRGQFCSTSQHNPHVWFLAGTFGGSAVRYSTIPYGKTVLFPVITAVFYFG
jgi:hypothetical protein